MRLNGFLALLLFTFCTVAPGAHAGIGVLGTPVDGSTVSGVSVISGYHCTSTDIEIRIDGTSIGRAGAGTTLPSTAAVCGHAETGYSLLFNWNNLSPGQHTVAAYADGDLIATNTISTQQSGGTAWLAGASQAFAVPNFPQSGKTATVEWVQSIQNFMVTEVAGSTMRLALLAGSIGGDGKTNGVGTDARFHNPLGVAADGAGNVYVADSDNHTIRKIAPSGEVTTLAGMPGQFGSLDGQGARARFWKPAGLAVDGAGNVYVADTNNYTIRKITPSGMVTTFAGKAGTYGDADGQGTDARFVNPEGIAVGGSGNVLVADTGNGTLRKVTPTGLVSTLAGSAGIHGNVDGLGAVARFALPKGIALDTEGNIYVADFNSSTIRKVTPTGNVSTLAGTPYQTGSTDGPAASARFNSPTGVAVDAAGNVYVADSGWYGYLQPPPPLESNSTIRKITPAGQVSTLAGVAGSYGSDDGVGAAARFYMQNGIAAGPYGDLYVADTWNHTVRRLTPDGTVSTLAGLALVWGSADGQAGAAGFQFPTGVVAGSDGTVYVADTYNHTLRKIDADGTTTTLAGLAGAEGSADGKGAEARFTRPRFVALDANGNLYVTDNANHTIRKVTQDGTVTTLAGLAGNAGSSDGNGTSARFYSPGGIAVDAAGNVYVADSGNKTIRKITHGGAVTTLAGQAGSMESVVDGMAADARFGGPSGLALDATGNLYVADGSTIRKLTPAGQVSTLAGLAYHWGSTDGKGSEARFYSPYGIAVGADGNVYVADMDNYAIRRVTPAGVVSTYVGRAGNRGIVLGDLPGGLSQPLGVAAYGPGLAITTSNAVLIVKPDQSTETLRLHPLEGP